MSAIITIEKACRSFGAFPALRNVSGTIERGEVVVICGPSGSGKSTLVRTINALERIDSGCIHVSGRDVHANKTDINKLRQSIGFVFQQYNLFPHLTAVDNVALGLRKLLRWSEAEARERALTLLARVGLGHRAEYWPADLSGGEQQRVAIARALSMQPPLMLFDEPTSALDPEVVGEVLSIIRSLSKDNITLVCVTHEMGFAREVADWIWFMESGEILEKARPDAFFDAPIHPSARRFVATICDKQAGMSSSQHPSTDN
jgi:polar amino acid transport system ATP-binding protein